MHHRLAVALFALLSGVATLQAQAPAEVDAIRKQLRAGEYAAALGVLADKVKADPKDAVAWTLMARAQAETGRLVDAAASLDQALAAAPTHLEARTFKAELLAARGSYPEAIALADALLKEDGGNLHARLALVDGLLQTGDTARAEKELEPFFDIYNAASKGERAALTADDLYCIGQGVWTYGARKGDKDSIKQAIERLFPEALKLDPQHIETLTFAGFGYLSKHDAGEAGKWFQEALSINGSYALALLGKGAAALEMNDYQQGPALIQQALAKNPALRDGIILSAQDAIRRRLYDQALQILEKAREINPRHGETLGYVAGVRLLNGDFKGFAELEQAATAANPKPAQFYYIVGMLHTNRLLFEEGQQYLEKAVELDPHLWDAMIALGLNSLRLGYDVKAKQQLDLATAKDPFNIWAMNTYRLLQSYDREFSTFESPNYRIRLHNSEREFMEPYVVALAEDCWNTLCARYKYTPKEQVVLEMFPNHGDLSVRTFGLSGLGILGACFGRVIVLDSPKAQEVHGPFNWGSVLWHEMAHVFALQVSGNRVPRWFTEGLSTYEEKLGRPGWEREMEYQMFQAWHAGSLAALEKMDQNDTGGGGDLLNYYLYGSLVAEYIHTQHGFDKILRILELYKAGKNTTQAFMEALGMDLPKLEAAVGQYVKLYVEQLKLRAPLTEDRQKQILADFSARPDDAEVMAQYARLLVEQDKLSDAQQWAERALEKDAKNLTATLALGHLWNRKRPARLKKVVEYLNKAIDLGADDYGTYFTLARAYHQLKDVESAVAEYLQARRCFPRAIMKDQSPSQYLLEIYNEKAQGELYRKELEYLVAIDHDDFPRRMELAKIYRQEGKRDDMLRVLESAIYIEPRDLKLHAYLAEGYKEAGRQDEAVRELGVTVVLAKKVNDKGKLDQRIADWYCDMAEIRVAQNQPDEARRWLREAMAIQPGHPRARELSDKLK